MRLFIIDARFFLGLGLIFMKDRQQPMNGPDAEAERLLRDMRHRREITGPTVRGEMTAGNLFHPEHALVRFTPDAVNWNRTDPSYHLPAFYDLFAEDGPEADSARWTSIAEESRAFLVLSAHPTTGLHPDYAGFDGVGVAGGDQHEQFRYDAWRVVMNMAVDYAWFSRDRAMRLQVEKYHEFFSTRITADNVQGALFLLDGTAPATGDGGSSTALTATLAAGSLASQRDDRARFVNAAWNVGQQQGLYRYYQESVYLLGLLNVAGKFNHTF